MNGTASQITAEKPCLPPFAPDQQFLITGLLRNVCRSFYLTLRVLPEAIRPQISFAYLFARASDTVADTEAVPLAERLGILRELREWFRRPKAGTANPEDIG